MTETLERRPAGRPRSEETNRAIQSAALDLLVEEGFGRMSIEGVAARAGVGKASVYRRWPSKEALVVDAIAERCLDSIVTPDTGSVRADVAAMLSALASRFRRDGSVMMAFLAESDRHPDLAERFRNTFLAERRAALREIVERGIARGELAADTDVDLLTDVGPALLWHRFVVRRAALPADLPQRIVDQFFR